MKATNETRITNETAMMAAARGFFVAAIGSVVVMRLVLSLRVHALVGLTRVAPLCGPERLLLGALGSDRGQRQQALEVLALTLGARGHRRGAHERLERVPARAA